MPANRAFPRRSPEAERHVARLVAWRRRRRLARALTTVVSALSFSVILAGAMVLASGPGRTELVTPHDQSPLGGPPTTASADHRPDPAGGTRPTTGQATSTTPATRRSPARHLPAATTTTSTSRPPAVLTLDGDAGQPTTTGETRHGTPPTSTTRPSTTTGPPTTVSPPTTEHPDPSTPPVDPTPRPGDGDGASPPPPDWSWDFPPGDDGSRRGQPGSRDEAAGDQGVTPWDSGDPGNPGQAEGQADQQDQAGDDGAANG